MGSRKPSPRGPAARVAWAVVGPPRAFGPRGPHNRQRGGAHPVRPPPWLRPWRSRSPDVRAARRSPINTRVGSDTHGALGLRNRTRRSGAVTSSSEMKILTKQCHLTETEDDNSTADQSLSARLRLNPSKSRLPRQRVETTNGSIRRLDTLMRARE